MVILCRFSSGCSVEPMAKWNVLFYNLRTRGSNCRAHLQPSIAWRWGHMPTTKWCIQAWGTVSDSGMPRCGPDTILMLPLWNFIIFLSSVHGFWGEWDECPAYRQSSGTLKTRSCVGPYHNGDDCPPDTETQGASESTVSLLFSYFSELPDFFWLFCRLPTIHVNNRPHSLLGWLEYLQCFQCPYQWSLQCPWNLLCYNWLWAQCLYRVWLRIC